MPFTYNVIGRVSIWNVGVPATFSARSFAGTNIFDRVEKLQLDIYELVGERFDKISPIIRLRSATNYLEIRYIDISRDESSVFLNDRIGVSTQNVFVKSLNHIAFPSRSCCMFRSILDRVETLRFHIFR